MNARLTEWTRGRLGRQSLRRIARTALLQTWRLQTTRGGRSGLAVRARCLGISEAGGLYCGYICLDAAGDNVRRFEESEHGSE
jgi:hypothetical protein